MKWQKILTAGLLAATLSVAGVAGAAPLQDGESIQMWLGSAPGSEDVSFHNKITERSQDPAQHDRMMTDIDVPELIAHVPAQPNGTALIVGPGGGYARVVMDKESDEVADWLNPQGVTVFILRYRLPSNEHKNRLDVSLEDGQRAMRIVRAHAKDWNIDPERIGIMGFSAGGHMASSVCTNYDRKVYEPVDDIDQVSARPNFSILGYPVISMLPQYAHTGTKKRLLGLNPSKTDEQKYSSELHVTAQTPPAFIFCAADDDVVPPINSIRYFRALRKQGVEAELHIFRHGGHGFGLGHKLTSSTRDWTHDCEGWLRDLGLIQ